MTNPTPTARRRRRGAVLHAEVPLADEPPSPMPAATPARTPSARDDRFVDQVRTLRVGSASVKLEERILMVIGGVLAPLGLVVVLLGWWGAAHSPYVFEQLPYVISGGLLGVGLIFLGSFLYFTHWITQLVKEHRTQSVALLEAIQRLEDRLDTDGHDAPAASSNGLGDAAATALVATERGSMAHRPDCVVVVGKSGLRRVNEADGLSVCKLCAS